MPVIVTKPEETEIWMTAPAEEALKLPRPLPDSVLTIVAHNVKQTSNVKQDQSPVPP
jgi:putative SOS response-associated peptidase YedK